MTDKITLTESKNSIKALTKPYRTRLDWELIHGRMHAMNYTKASNFCFTPVLWLVHVYKP
jgi:hypothetical protein